MWDEAKTTIQQKFYTAPYASFMPYGIYKGKLNEAHAIFEMWLQKRKRTPTTLGSVWKIVDYRYKFEADSSTLLPDIQWDGPCKLWVALWGPADTAIFITKVIPHLLTAGYSMTDERTGAWIDEREVMSVQSGSSIYSMSSSQSHQALGDNIEPMVLVDMPNHLQRVDVEGPVRQARAAKGIPTAKNCPIVGRRLG